MEKVAIYARVSTDKQTCENQLSELRALATRMGKTIIQKFIAEGISETKAKRPALDLMMKMAWESSKLQKNYKLALGLFIQSYRLKFVLLFRNG